jgi:hypothetical protein
VSTSGDRESARRAARFHKIKNKLRRNFFTWGFKRDDSISGPSRCTASFTHTTAHYPA